MHPIQYSYTEDEQEVVMTLLPLSSHMFAEAAFHASLLTDAHPSNDALSDALEEGLHRLALMHAMQHQGNSQQALMDYLMGHVPLSNEWLNHTN